MGFYDAHILPRIIECGCSTKPILRERRHLVPEAQGDVLEVGFGTGLNLSYYDAARVSGIWGLEPAEALRDRARPRIAATSIPFEFLGLTGEQIPAEDARFDSVVVTFTLCTIPAVGQALAEMRRVLKPEGTLYFVEHGAAPDPAVRKWQDRVTPAWRHIAGGCHLNRDIAGLVAAAGFEIAVQEAGYRRGVPRFMGYMTRGTAQPT